MSRIRVVTRRYYDPYGNPLGAAPGSWPGTKGFVGGTADAATGLTNLGAREYSPGTGSFLTTDPVLDPYDPQDLNPYAYAADNPATSSDPTGMCDSAGCPKDPCGPGYGGGGCDGNHSGPAPGDGTTNSPAPSQPVEVYAPG
jgi:RHS repeat-associated protein